MAESKKGNLGHFKWWTVECIASLVVIFSYYDELTRSDMEFSGRDLWVFYSSAGSAVISVCGLVVCLLPIERKACSLESLLVWFIAILRSITTIVAIIGRYRVDREMTLLSSQRLLTFNPNVYFFSLWALVASILMLASWHKEFITRGSAWKTSSQWILLGAMSFFTMLSALVLRDQVVIGEFIDPTNQTITRNDLVTSIQSLTNNQTIQNSTRIGLLTNGYLARDERLTTDPAESIFEALVEAGIMGTVSSCEASSDSCSRLHYVIALSATTAAIACILAPIKGADQTFQLDISIILLLLWLTALPIMTVSPGPATRAGNLYFGIYFCYFLVLNIFVSAVAFNSSSGDAEESKRAIDLDLTDSGPVNRNDLWQEAYDRMEISAGFEFDRDDDESYKSLFDEVEQWNEDTDARISALPGNNLSLEHELSSRRMTTYFVKRTSSLQLSEASASSSIRNSKRYIRPKGWKRRISRFRMWFISLTMAIILTHTISTSDFEVGIDSHIVAWLSIIISCIGLLTCFRTSRASYIIQVASIIIDLALWTYGAVFVGSQSSYTLGYSSAEDQVNLLLGGGSQRLGDDPNIFFCVWISLITAILLVTNIFKASLVTTDWLLLATASAALLVPSAEFIYRRDDINGTSIQSCDPKTSSTCKNYFLAFYLAIISLGISLLMALLFRFRLGPIFHVIVSVPLVIAWGSGVPIVTFLNTRAVPAAVYFAFWGGIFLALEIASVNIIIMRRDRRKRQEEALDQAKDENKDEACLLPVVREESQSNGLDSNGSIELKSSSSQKQDNKTQEKDSTVSEQSGTEIFSFGAKQSLVKESLEMNLSQTPHIESSINGKELHPGDSGVPTSNEQTDSEDKNANGECNRSAMDSNALQSRFRTSTVDTTDFKDCVEFGSTCHFDSTSYPPHNFTSS